MNKSLITATLLTTIFSAQSFSKEVETVKDEAPRHHQDKKFDCDNIVVPTEVQEHFIGEGFTPETFNRIQDIPFKVNIYDQYRELRSKRLPSIHQGTELQGDHTVYNDSFLTNSSVILNDKKVAKPYLLALSDVTQDFYFVWNSIAEVYIVDNHTPSESFQYDLGYTYKQKDRYVTDLKTDKHLLEKSHYNSGFLFQKGRSTHDRKVAVARAVKHFIELRCE